MKYLKEYKLFESITSNDDNSDLIKSIEEAFYNISDRYYVRILKSNLNNDLINVRILNSKPMENESNSLVKYNDIKDDLEVAIDYCINELKLNLDVINVFNYYYDLINSFKLSNLDFDVINNFFEMSIFFKIQKNDQNLV